jgi:YHS domain-containing protein
VAIRYVIDRDEASGDATFQQNVKSGLLLDGAELTYDTEKKVYRFRASYSDGVERNLAGRFAGNKLILESVAGDDERAYRVSVILLNEKRTLVQNEQRPATGGDFRRIAEVGYTREGTSLAASGAGGPECIVTGGTGTSTVTYKGKTYYVCCSGCRQAFEDDPEGILAEVAKRATERKSNP